MMNSLNKVKGALEDKDRRAYFRRCKVENLFEQTTLNLNLRREKELLRKEI